MLDAAGPELNQVCGQSIVMLRVRPGRAAIAREALHLPSALRWHGGDPAIYWLGPDQWLFVSKSKSCAEMIATIRSALSEQVFAATDTSAASVCLSLVGDGARSLLSMGCGLDLDERAFVPGHCARTRFAQVPALIAAVDANRYQLYVECSYSTYLKEWLSRAVTDPLIEDFGNRSRRSQHRE